MSLDEVRLEVPLKAPAFFDVARTALFLDLDGTLAAIEPTPDGVKPDPARTATLSRLDQVLQGRIAVLSGRPIEQIDDILEGAVTRVAGLHGLERRSGSGEITRVEPHPALDDIATELETLARAQRGLLVERKSAAVAIHYRNAPDAGPAVVEAARRLARQHHLILQEGKMVAELRTPGPDKGDALTDFMAEASFAGSIPWMIGDDLTDEDAFGAAVDLGGHAILIGEPRPSRAQWRLESPAALLAWLGLSLEAATIRSVVSA